MLAAAVRPAAWAGPVEIRGVIFDADGTLVDSEAPGLDVLHETARSLGVTWSRESVHERFRGVRMGDCVAILAAAAGLSDAAFEADCLRQVREAMAARFRQGLDAMPGAGELLQGLHLPFCVATNGPREKVELTLSLTGLRPWFGERVYCAYEVGSFKPDPGLFLHAARAMGIAPGACVVVEDSLTGVAAGVAAGMTVYTLLASEDIPVPWRGQVTAIAGLSDLAPLLA